MTTVNRNRVKPLFSFLLTVAVILICHFPVHAPLCYGARSKGIEVVIADAAGQRVGLYQGSYALLIGISDYTAGWPDLGSVPGELNRVEAALKKQGFEVVKVMNPTAWVSIGPIRISSIATDTTPETACSSFSGHGHTRKGGARGIWCPQSPARRERVFAKGPSHEHDPGLVPAAGGPSRPVPL